MLILVLGPSGVGKSTLIARLNTELGMRVVHTYTTRPARADDLFKTSVPSTSIDALAQQGRLFLRKPPIFDHEYAEDWHQLQVALCSKRLQLWLLDMGWRNLSLYRSSQTRHVLLLPKCINDLAIRLNLSGRTNRHVSETAELHHWKELAREHQTSYDWCTIETHDDDTEAVFLLARSAIAIWVDTCKLEN